MVEVELIDYDELLNTLDEHIEVAMHKMRLRAICDLEEKLILANNKINYLTGELAKAIRTINYLRYQSPRPTRWDKLKSLFRR